MFFSFSSFSVHKIERATRGDGYIVPSEEMNLNHLLRIIIKRQKAAYIRASSKIRYFIYSLTLFPSTVLPSSSYTSILIIHLPDYVYEKFNGDFEQWSSPANNWISML
ncbi:hypothetical protein OCU04_012760 [Sclerotinia nivalis]|uniref:Uncharacterized protein n=1 Tax=Sclerotinia nivalis TaxID=352851 RepID=A0A9X0AAH9_9HELO|nr:hypothetical protein OCU04_012760 [Sclerotinia nivalis]